MFRRQIMDISMITFLTLVLGQLLINWGGAFPETGPQVDEQTKFEMFCAAIDNQSTAPNYLVATVKNSNTGETREICTEAPNLTFAKYLEENNWDFEDQNFNSRYFQFSNDTALALIGFEQYAAEELRSYAKTLDLDLIVSMVKSREMTGKTFEGNQKEQTMFAHLMFNSGIMMRRGCLAGNICSLHYYKE